MFEYKNPKIAIFIKQIKIIAKFNYKKIAFYLLKINNIEIKTIYLLDNIRKFIKNYYKTSKKEISIQDLFIGDSFDDKINDICRYFVQYVYEIKSEEKPSFNNNIYAIDENLR